MNYAALQRKYEAFSTPRFSVRAGGEEFGEYGGVVSSVEVDTTVDGADSFSLALGYPFDLDEGAFDGLDWNLFAVGTPVEISVGYLDRVEPLFVGQIHAVRSAFPSDVGPSVEVSGYGRLHELMREKRSRSWNDRADSDVAADVAAEYGFADVTAAETGVVHATSVQDAETDYRFLKRLAGRNGFVVFAHRDELTFGPPASDAEPVVTLEYGESVGSFTPEVNDSDRVSAVEVRHWNPRTREEIVGTATVDGDVDGAGTEVVRLPVESVAEATQAAEAILGRTRSGLVRASGSTVGIPEIRAGTTVRVDRIDRFSGVYYVERATHRVGSGGYETTFEAREVAG